MFTTLSHLHSLSLSLSVSLFFSLCHFFTNNGAAVSTSSVFVTGVCGECLASPVIVTVSCPLHSRWSMSTHLELHVIGCLYPPDTNTQEVYLRSIYILLRLIVFEHMRPSTWSSTSISPSPGDPPCFSLSQSIYCISFYQFLFANITSSPSPAHRSQGNWGNYFLSRPSVLRTQAVSLHSYR